MIGAPSPSMESAPTRSTGPRNVTNLLLNLRGEHFRRGLNAQRVRAARALAQQERGPSLPLLVPIPTLPSRVIIPSSSSAPSALSKRPAAGPPPPQSWTKRDEQSDGVGFDRDSVEWRAFALEPVYSRLPGPPLRTDTLLHLCLQQIIEIAPEILPELPLHMKRHALMYTAVASPLPGDILRELAGAGSGEIVLSRSYGPLFLQRSGVLDFPSSTASDNAWDDEDLEGQVDGAQVLHTLIMLDCPLPPSVLSRLPATLTHLAILALPTSLPGLHRLPTLLPLLTLLDLSFNPWLNEGETLSRVPWERWRALESVGLRGCALVNEASVTERIQLGRINDVEVYF